MAQESMSEMHVSCASWLVQVSCPSFFSVCQGHKSWWYRPYTVSDVL